MVTRIWRGWTTPENAAAYERLLLGEIFPAIAARLPEGYRGFSVNRRDSGREVEFLTTMWFDSLHAIKAFVGDDVETAHVPAKARELLVRFDARVAHYEQLVPPPAGLS